MKVGQFKQLLKETVREVLKEELRGIKKELLEHRKIIQPMQKVGGFTAPNYSKINSITTIPIPSTTEPISLYENSGDPLIDLLNETKYNTDPSEWQNFGDFTQNMAQSYNANHFKTSEPEVGTVGDMLSNQPRTNNIDQVSIDVVPDFSKFMGAMKEQGQI